jgi:hypothetical protein
LPIAIVHDDFVEDIIIERGGGGEITSVELHVEFPLNDASI